MVEEVPVTVELDLLAVVLALLRVHRLVPATEAVEPVLLEVQEAQALVVQAMDPKRPPVIAPPGAAI